MPEKCKTCIFRVPQDGGTILSSERIAEIHKYLIEGTQHICHFNPKRACRGGRDLQLKVFFAIGAIPEMTDEALAIANREYLAKQDRVEHEKHLENR